MPEKLHETPEHVPACMRGDLRETLAYEGGWTFAEAGLSRDNNPHDPKYGGDEARMHEQWDAGWREFYAEGGS